MLRLAVRRLLLAAPLVLVVSALSYILIAITPGDPAATILGTYASRAQDQALDRQLGFDQPVWVQYWHWLTRAVHGDLGTSFLSANSVTSLIGARAGATIALVAGATALSALIGIALGTLSATRGGLPGALTDSAAMLGFAIPSFWLGLVLVDLVAIRGGLLPATGFVPFDRSPLDWLRSLALPTLTLAAGGATGIAKQTRDAMKDALARDFIDALRADGVPEWLIVWRHALRNAAIPVLTMIGILFVGMLGGTVLVENVFAVPGLGGLAVSATLAHDLPTVQGVAISFAIAVVVVNLVIDLLYGWLNPRARVA